jgi:BASS family bile acid:Na+ symporter
MTLAQLIPTAISVSIFLTVLAFGLNAPLRDALFLFQRPGLLLRSILSMNVVMVLFAVAIVSLFDLAPAIKIALIAISVSPVPPIMPRKQEKAGGSSAYTIGLLVAAVVVAVILIPLWIEVLGRYFEVDAHVRPRELVPVATLTVIGPLIIGMLIRHFAPGFAERIVKAVALTAAILLVVAVLPVLLTQAGPMWNMIGNGVLVVLATFSLVGLAVGHFLGGPDPDNRTVLAFATSARHPAIAMTIAGLTFPDQKPLVIVVVLLHVIVGFVLGMPYQAWRVRSHATNATSVIP